MARLSSVSRRVVVPRRRKGWEEGPGQIGLQAAISTSNNVIMASGASLLDDGSTLLRIRGMLTLQLTTATVAPGGFTGAFGINIVRGPAFAVGVSAVPTPITEQGLDSWIFWEAWSVTTVTATIADGVNAVGCTVRIPVDSKAMRKLDLGDVIYATMEFNEIGVSILQSHFDSRVLLTLP